MGKIIIWPCGWLVIFILVSLCYEIVNSNEFHLAGSSNRGNDNSDILLVKNNYKKTGVLSSLSFPAYLQFGKINNQRGTSKGGVTVKFDFDFIRKSFMPVFFEPIVNTIYVLETKENYWSIFLFSTLDFDKSRNIDSRLIGGFGPKYTFNNYLSTSLALLIEKQRNRDAAWRFSLRQKFKWHKVSLVWYYKPNVVLLSDFYLLGNIKLKIENKKPLPGLEIKASFDYDNNLLPPLEKRDAGINVSMFWSY